MSLGGSSLSLLDFDVGCGVSGSRGSCGGFVERRMPCLMLIRLVPLDVIDWAVVSLQSCGFDLPLMVFWVPGGGSVVGFS